VIGRHQPSEVDLLTIRFLPDFPVGSPLELRLFLEAQTAKKRHTIFEAAFMCPQVVERLAPQAGFELATLRLTGGKNVVSRALPPFADLCRTLRQPRRIWRFSGFALCRALPPFAALCCCQRARKGQRPNSNPKVVIITRSEGPAPTSPLSLPTSRSSTDIFPADPGAWAKSQVFSDLRAGS
jgi:hypothetical protein